jgi:hypothetical protein
MSAALAPRNRVAIRMETSMRMLLLKRSLLVASLLAALPLAASAASVVKSELQQSMMDNYVHACTGGSGPIYLSMAADHQQKCEKLAALLRRKGENPPAVHIVGTAERRSWYQTHCLDLTGSLLGNADSDPDKGVQHDRSMYCQQIREDLMEDNVEVPAPKDLSGMKG